jgi:GT2 family glycosyltransferase
MITYCVPTYRSFDLCVKSIAAVLRGSFIPDRIIVKDDSGEGAALPALLEFSEKNDFPIDIIVSPSRDGVAASWNRLVKESGEADYIIIANDDIEVQPDTLQKMVDAATASEEIFFYADARMGNAFSLFLIKRAGYEKIGPFNEHFYPAYFEDNDYSWRLRLAGHQLVSVYGAMYAHVGSSTLARYTPDEMAKHHSDFQRNELLYTRMWGGRAGNEHYTAPFNGGRAPWE